MILILQTRKSRCLVVVVVVVILLEAMKDKDKNSPLSRPRCEMVVQPRWVGR